MKKNLKSGWCSVFKCCYKSLVFIGVFCCSLGFGMQREETVLNPLSVSTTAVEQSVRVTIDINTAGEKDPNNPYQLIYDAYVESKILDESMIRTIENSFVNLSYIEDIRKLKKYQKNFLWKLVSPSKDDPNYFSVSQIYSYEQNDKEKRINWRNSIQCRENNPFNTFFKSLLTLDMYQDMEMPDLFFKKLIELCTDEIIGVNLNNWRLIIQEEDLKNFTRNTLLESSSKNWSIESTERFLPFIKSLIYVSSGIATFSLVLTQISTKVNIVKDAPFLTVYNTTYNETFLNLTSKLLANLTVVPVLLYLGCSDFRFNLTANQYQIDQTTCTTPININLAIVAFVGVVGGFFLDVWLGVSHTVLYCIYRLLFGINIEYLSSNMIEKVYNKSKEITDLENKKSFIKSMGNYITDKLKKSWTPSRLNADFEKELTERVNSFK